VLYANPKSLLKKSKDSKLAENSLYFVAEILDEVVERVDPLHHAE